MLRTDQHENRKEISHRHRSKARAALHGKSIQLQSPKLRISEDAKIKQGEIVQHLVRRYQASAFSCLERGGLDRGLRLSLACPPTYRAGALPAVYPRHHTSNTFIFHTSARVFRRECVRMRKVEIEKSLAQWKVLRYEDLHRQ